MNTYYEDRLSGERLKRVYEIATPRIRRYLEAEVEHAAGHVAAGDSVLELGCGYGRILPRLGRGAGLVMGIDNSPKSVSLAGLELSALANCRLACMDAACLGIRSSTFDCTVCIQNGISAFHTDRAGLVKEAMRVTRPGGIVLFSSYSGGFWEPRLEWFMLQAEAGLLGEIDQEKTGDGRIVCKDGFVATTVGPEEFRALAAGLGVDATIVEVDGSSLFCEIEVT